ncbi:MAG: D-serine deaminase-like pyridoxal phosphate-dependent protein [Granulosicoccus sp.]|jgi:D-serine deaminase-like pyridoxal phosphate-dependent protein
MTNCVDDIDMPALIVDESIVRDNISAKQNHCNKAGLKFRPHIKTQTSVRITGDGESAASFMKLTLAQRMVHGVHNFIVSIGGTPDMWQAQSHEVFTEYRAGTIEPIESVEENNENIKNSDVFCLKLLCVRMSD